MSTCTRFTETTTISIEETMGAMHELVDAGKIRFICVSNLMLHDLKNTQKAMTSTDCFKPVRYNLIDPNDRLWLAEVLPGAPYHRDRSQSLATSLPAFKQRTQGKRSTSWHSPTPGPWRKLLSIGACRSKV